MEEKAGLIGGNIFTGELAWIRSTCGRLPATRTSVRRARAFITAPERTVGAGISGIPGWQAFKQAKKDKAVRGADK